MKSSAIENGKNDEAAQRNDLPLLPSDRHSPG
jgi:hypothetical protein